MTSFARWSAVAAGVLALGLAGCNNTEGPVSATATAGGERSRIAADCEAALTELYRIQPGTRELGDRARAVLVFPGITQAGLGVGGLYGRGCMIENGRTENYYNIVGGTVGFQIGGQSFSQAYFFNNAEALKTFRETKGLQLGAGVTAVAASYGANGAITTSTLQKPVVVVTWGQSGLMAGANIEGVKITELSPS
jgi:lipid-binding SYLF domain-containing protein